MRGREGDSSPTWRKQTDRRRSSGSAPLKSTSALLSCEGAGSGFDCRSSRFEFSELLLERPGETVTREELRQRLWPADVFVAVDQSLNNAVKKLRAALR